MRTIEAVAALLRIREERRLEQLEPEREWILAGGDRDLVDERLEHERERIAARRAMRTRRHTERHQRRLEVVVRDKAGGNSTPGIRRVREALLALRVVAVADEVIAPRHELAGRIDTSLQEMESSRPIVVMMHVVFTRPQHLDRHTDLLGDGRSFAHVVVGETPNPPPARWMWIVMFDSGIPSALDTS